MDRERFDALARLLAATGSRRGAIGALIGAGLLGTGLEAEARKRNGNRRGGGGKGKDRDKDKDKDRGKGNGKTKDRKKRAQAEPAKALRNQEEPGYEEGSPRLRTAARGSCWP